ncbi:MAG: hypothetical protein M1120_01005 [Patescibacteria group bacterium]|nr:hypothetical protein [Patescibacteria group bacterium]
MTNQIELAIGTTVRFPEDSSVGMANRIISDKETHGERDILRPMISEFDLIITRINSLEDQEIDECIAPHLKKIVGLLSANGLRLPTLSQIRENNDPQVREGVNKVMEEVRKGLAGEKKEWGWLNELKTPRLIVGSLFVDSYKHLLAVRPEFQEHEDINSLANNALEEASLLYYPEFGINRGASRWYTVEEGFTQDFTDFTQAVKLIEICRTLEPNILSRKNMEKVWKFIKEHPRDVLELIRTLNQAVGDLNQIVTEHDVPEMLKNIKDSQAVISDYSLPLFLGETEPGFDIRNLQSLKRGLKRTNFHMAIGESVNQTSELPETIQNNLDYARFHVDVSDPKAIFAGLITHMVEYWTKSNPSYRLLGRDTMINALCEIIGYKHFDSELFKLLYDKDGLNWYSVDWGFKQEFIDYIDKKVKTDQK